MLEETAINPCWYVEHFFPIKQSIALRLFSFNFIVSRCQFQLVYLINLCSCQLVGQTNRIWIILHSNIINIFNIMRCIPIDDLAFLRFIIKAWKCDCEIVLRFRPTVLIVLVKRKIFHSLLECTLIPGSVILIRRISDLCFEQRRIVFLLIHICNGFHL